LHVEADIRFIRRLHRDVEERGRSLDSVIGQYYETVRPMYQKFLDPQRQFANFVVGEETDIAAGILAAKINELLDSPRFKRRKNDFSTIENKSCWRNWSDWLKHDLNPRKSDTILIDAGILFPYEDLFEIDYLIPDLSSIPTPTHLIITHGHEDHIGAVYHVIKQFPQIKVVASPFTASLIRKNLNLTALLIPLLSIIIMIS